MPIIGIIGGSGLDDPDILENYEEMAVETPYGVPSSPLYLGTLRDKSVVVLVRHGRRHQFSPTQVNFRANIYALKEQGVTHILASTACGSLRVEIGRGDFVILDQFIDFTRFRKNTFHESFENGSHHVSMPDPFDEGLRRTLYESAEALGFKVHPTGTVVTIEGPRFSTRAESRMFQAWGGDVINMSVATEAALANEAGVPYAAVAMSTDYDCWKDDEPPVSWEQILTVFHRNAENVKKLLIHAVGAIE